MAHPTNDPSGTTEAAAGPTFPKMMTLAEVKDVLNVGMPTLYGLLRSGELRGVQIGGRAIWRVAEADLTAYLDTAYRQTRERIESGQIPDGEASED